MSDINEVIKRVKGLPVLRILIPTGGENEHATCEWQNIVQVNPADRDALLDELERLRDVISRAIYRLDPNAPNDEPYILTGAITLKEAELERLQQENAELRKILHRNKLHLASAQLMDGDA